MKLKQDLLSYNGDMVAAFAAESGLREEYRRKHPTHVVTFECMDGRSRFSGAAKMPKGFVRPRRNIGAKFEMGWPTMHERTLEEMGYAYSKGRNCLFVPTYHYSAGDAHHGCAGFKYDTQAAMNATLRLRNQLNLAYRGVSDLQSNYAVMVGIETDQEAFIFHATEGEEAVSMSTVEDTSDKALSAIITRLYPDMPARIMADLVPIMRSNVEHVHELRGNKPEAELNHREPYIFFGHGFDWFKHYNRALIVNDDDPNKGRNVGVAGSIVLANRENKRIEDTGAVVLVSVPYYEDHERNASILHVQYLAELAQESIKEACGEKAEFFSYLTCVMHWKSRRLEVIE